MAGVGYSRQGGIHGDTAPDFTQDSSIGPISLHEWLGDSWGILFSHPADYTPVCTTELGATAKLADEFKKRNVKVLALSVDPVASHHGWIKDINETQGTTVNFPILADADRKVSTLYDLIHPNASATATVLLPEPDRPVNQMVAPAWPSSLPRSARVTSPSCQVTLVAFCSVMCVFAWNGKSRFYAAAVYVKNIIYRP